MQVKKRYYEKTCLVTNRLHATSEKHVRVICIVDYFINMPHWLWKYWFYQLQFNPWNLSETKRYTQKLDNFPVSSRSIHLLFDESHTHEYQENNMTSFSKLLSWAATTGPFFNETSEWISPTHAHRLKTISIVHRLILITYEILQLNVNERAFCVTGLQSYNFSNIIVVPLNLKKKLITRYKITHHMGNEEKNIR